MKIVATSEESKDFASMTLTKDELVSVLETRARKYHPGFSRTIAHSSSI